MILVIFYLKLLVILFTGVNFWIFSRNFSSICKICELTALGQAVRTLLLYRNSLAFNSEDYDHISEIVKEICEE